MYALLVIGAVVFGAVAALLVVRGRVILAGAGRGGVLTRLVAVQDELRRQLSPLGAYIAFVLAGLAAVVAICWPLGRLAKRLQPVDRSLYRYAGQHHSHALTGAMKILTQMGNRSTIKIVLVVAIIGLGLLWWRRWWVPVLVLVTSYPAEKFLQSVLAKVVHRGHPPSGLGTYPSGGVARLVLIYGVIWLLVLLRFPRLDKRIGLLGWVVLGVAAWVEGFSRFYLLKHWTTDVVGGWIFGLLLLVVLVVLASTLCRPAPFTARPDVQQDKAETLTRV